MPMSDYLPIVVPDYAGSTLIVSPQNVLVTRGGYIQSQQKTDGGRVKTGTLNTPPVFAVTLEWGGITDADKNAILDFYFDQSKGFGVSRSFPWRHPSELTDYVVKFATGTQIKVFASGIQSMPSVSLLVLGTVS